VYWRRRVTLVVMLGLVLAAVWQTRVNRGDSDDPPAMAQSDAGSDAAGSGGAVPTMGRALAASAAVGAAASTSAPGMAGGAASTPPVRPVLAQPVGRCDPATTIARADAPETVTSGAGATLQVRLSTTATEACTLALTDRLLVQVARDDEAIWRLEDCPSALTTASVALHPAWSTVIDIAWSGRVSNARCGLETAVAAPGTYSLQAAILSGEPGSAELEVRAAEQQRPARRDQAGQTG
jgi:hypothetical protein